MKDKRAITIFLLITFILSGFCYYIRIIGEEAASGMTSVLMWCPGISAFITQRLFYRGNRILGFHKFRFEFIIMAFVIPMLYLGISYGIYWYFSKGTFNWQPYTKSIIMLLVLLISSSITALGEEIGWRGFLLPKMSEVWNVRVAVLLSGFIWAVWHYPLMIAGLYNPGTPIWYQLLLFTIEVIAITAILTILRLKSNSIWPVTILHASHNFLNQIVFSPLTVGEKSVYFVGETGFITAFMIVLVATILFIRYKPIQSN